MELSPKVVTKHWLKLFGFSLVLLALTLAGLVLCVVGIFVTAPVALAATVYAYEDIFGTARKKMQAAAARVGPFGTTAAPGRVPAVSFAGGGGGAWKTVVDTGVAGGCIL